MIRLLGSFLGRMLRTGNLEIVDSRNTVHVFGNGEGPKVRARFTTASAEWAVLTNPELRLGEAYMDGTFVLDEGSIYDFMETVLSNIGLERAGWMAAIERLGYYTRRIQQHNTLRRARRNITHHYDLDGAFYRLFLDADRQYSCAYYESPSSDLDDAQLAKKRHLAAKLYLEPGQKVLDIGSGWGGLGLYLAEVTDSQVTGVTLSEEQFAVSNARAQERGLSERTRFLLQDYRELQGPFDRIVSVGMFEHVGVGHYKEFFAKCRDLLTDDGVMVLHSIGRADGPSVTNSWIQKYIFPGGYIPAVSEVIPPIEKAGLKITDMEILRLHYAKTLRAWRERFMERWDEAKDLYDERFCRMWEFYLVGAETAFRYQGMMNFQIQLTKNQHALPLTRNYMSEAEEELRSRDTKLNPMRLAGE